MEEGQDCGARANSYGCRPKADLLPKGEVHRVTPAITAQEQRNKCGFTRCLGRVVQLTKPHHNFVVFRDIHSVLQVVFIPGRELGQCYRHQIWGHGFTVVVSRVTASKGQVVWAHRLACLLCQQDPCGSLTPLPAFGKLRLQTRRTPTVFTQSALQMLFCSCVLFA